MFKVEVYQNVLHPKAPLCKGGCHANSVTGGLCGKMLRICIGLRGMQNAVVQQSLSHIALSAQYDSSLYTREPFAASPPANDKRGSGEPLPLFLYFVGSTESSTIRIRTMTTRVRNALPVGASRLTCSSAGPGSRSAGLPRQREQEVREVQRELRLPSSWSCRTTCSGPSPGRTQPEPE